MNQITKTDEVSKLRGQLAAMGPEIKSALPSHIKPEKFQRVVMTVVQTTPDLVQADRRTLLAACLKCAADGLVPDGREAALVIFNTKNKDGGWEKRVQYMPMMAGILKRIRNAGEIASIQSHVIYENDHFVIKRGLNDTLEHEPKFPGERGKPIGAYAVAKFKDGSDPQFEVMDLNQINAVRNASRAKDSGPWSQWWDEMARKTVFRRLSKWLPMDAETEELMRRDDEGPTIEGAPIVEGVAQEGRTSRLDALEQQVAPHDGDGEIIEAEISDDAPSEALQSVLDEISNLSQNEVQHLHKNAAFTAKLKRLTDDERAAFASAVNALPEV